MIGRGDLLDIISRTDPRFASAVRKFVDEWQDDPETNEDGLPFYLLFDMVARIVATNIRRGEHENFDAIFKLIEKLHVDGDDYVRESATVGMLEGIQNIMLAENTGLHLAHSFLLPESKKWWDKLILFWEHGDTTALHDG